MNDLQKIICLLNAIYVTNVNIVNMLAEMDKSVGRFPPKHPIWKKMKDLDIIVKDLFE